MTHDKDDQTTVPITVRSDKGKVTFYIDPSIDHKIEVLCAISKISKSQFAERSLKKTLEMLKDDEKMTWQEISDRVRSFIFR